MNWKHRTAAAGLAAAMTAGLAACGGNTSWAAKSGGDTMSAGVYILSQIESYYVVNDEYSTTLGASETETDPVKIAKKLMAADFEGKPGSDYIGELVNKDVKRYFAAESLFAREGLAFSAAEEALAKQNTQRVWQQDPLFIANGQIVRQDTSAFYEQNGVAESSVEAYTRNQIKQNLLLDSMYGVGGEREIADTEFQSYFKDTRARIQILQFPLTDAEGAALSEDDAKAVEEKANTYLARMKKGEDYDAVVQDYLKETFNGSPPPGAREDYEILITKESSVPTKNIAVEMMGAPLNDPRLYKEANGIFVISRVDAMANPDEYEAQKSTMTREMKQEEFDAWLIEQGSGLDIAFNQSALNRYTLDKLNFKVHISGQ